LTGRSEFINSISEKLGRKKPDYIQPLSRDRNPWDSLYDTDNRKELIDRFCVELESLSASVIRVAGRESVPSVIKTFLMDIGSKEIVVWGTEDEIGLLIRKGCGLFTDINDAATVVEWNSNENGDGYIDIAARSDTGLCYAEFGIAETGTVVVYSGGEKGRSVSLLPDCVGIILEAKRIVPRITQVLSELRVPALEHACINFISGPSRSADIEMSLSIGVHGPGKITVFIIE
jgi:L-lactate dehydrogenase complex protein LldG